MRSQVHKRLSLVSPASSRALTVTHALSRLPIFFCLLLAPSVCHAQFSITGGTAAQRADLAQIEQHVLAPVALPGSPVTVHILTEQQMSALVHMVQQSNGPATDSEAESAGLMPGDANDDGDVDGLYDDLPPTISLINDDPAPDLELTFVHEYGHHIWAHFVTNGEQRAFQKLYDHQRAKHQLVTDYAGVCKEEGFAEAFAYYLMQPQTLLQRDPPSYRYMETLVARLRLACQASGQAHGPDV